MGWALCCVLRLLPQQIVTPTPHPLHKGTRTLCVVAEHAMLFTTMPRRAFQNPQSTPFYLCSGLERGHPEPGLSLFRPLPGPPVNLAVVT